MKEEIINMNKIVDEEINRIIEKVQKGEEVTNMERVIFNQYYNLLRKINKIKEK